MKRKLLVAIDGPAGSGKSSTAKALAKSLGVPFIDTGAMYRALTLKAMREKIAFDDKKALVACARRSRIELKGKDPLRQRVFLDGRDVTAAIRRPEVTNSVFHVAQEPRIRRVLVQKQRELGRRAGGVMEGRDIGTVVFPRADFKFFFVASAAVRALRRQQELAAAGRKLPLSEVRRDLLRRDRTDYRRKEGPLRRAADAIRLDTSSLTIPATVDKMLALIRSKSLKKGRLGKKS
jgi:CMP/dCMP kinase